MAAPTKAPASVVYTAVAAALVACFLALALWQVDGQDATYDEGFYFGVGRTILQRHAWEGTVLLHPPLAYYVASLPLLFERGEVSPADARQLLLSRLASLIAFGVPLLLVVRAWAARLYGPAAGLAALALAAFSPTLLAHAPLITPDAALAATTLLTLYVYWRCGPEGPVWPWAAALGLALLSKVSALIVVVALVLLELPRLRRQPRAVARRLGAAALVSWLVLNAGYGFAGFFDARGKAAMLEKVPPVPALRAAARVAAPLFPLPYLRSLGRQAHVGAQGRPGYLLGEVATGGWRHYYLVALAVKETVPFLLLLLVALSSLWWLPPARDAPPLLVPALLFFLVFSLGTVQIGIRYVLPALPFLFVFCARLLRERMRAPRAWPAAVAVLLAAHAASTVRGGPDFLSYFNEAAGGPDNGYRYLGDSNLDWGQNRTRAEEYARRTGALFEPLLLPPHGRVVLSTNRVQGFMDPPRYRRLRDEYTPLERVGHNWFVYDLDRNFRFAPGSILPVLSGPEWLAGPPDGAWTQPAFAAPAWSAAPAVDDPRLPLEESFPGTMARLMTCAGGATECAFRRELALTRPPAQAILYMATRGRYELYVNGRRAAEGGRCAPGFVREQQRLTEELGAGTNVLALRADACGDRAPRVFVEMRVAR